MKKPTLDDVLRAPQSRLPSKVLRDRDYTDSKFPDMIDCCYCHIMFDGTLEIVEHTHDASGAKTNRVMLFADEDNIIRLRDFLNRWFPDAPSEPVKDGE